MPSPDLPHPRFARLYLRAAPDAERRGAGEHRQRLLAGATGRVLEPGAGQGLNFPHYPSTVSDVLAVEPEPTLRAAAEVAARGAAVPVRVIAGVADALPPEDDSIDVVVTSLVLCSVPDQARALAEIRRVLRPGGELRFYEHVVAAHGPRRAFLRLADRSGLWPALAGGCHPARDTVGAIERAGFAVASIERFGFVAARLTPSIPHVLGIARPT
jgi:SAM-dependent methyltransferase